ncbi:MAG: PEP-CTERM sorting domain-containing protein [Burkholderiaceae bacterium]|nr:PEP-CTERM sorting domain-containing protein [Burkholderiaceae bacterium]
MFKELVRSCAFAASTLIGIAHADVLVVDTGPGYASTGGSFAGGPNNPLGVAFGQSLAGRFNLTTTTKITSIQGWLANYSTDNAELTVSIFNTIATDPGARLFSSAFSLGPTDNCSGCLPSWTGPSGLNWNLGPGTYWVVFEGLNDQTGMATFTNGVASPLASYKWFSPSFASYWNTMNSTLGWGVQIGAAQPIPEPATLPILILGIGVISVVVRRARQA